MGRRGPAPAPVELKILKGERADRRPRNPARAKPGMPAPPRGMRREVRSIWDYTVDQIEFMRTATPADRDVLVAYCECVADHRAVSAELAKSTLMVTGSTGNLVANPLIQRKTDLARTIARLAAEFGLTPRARAEFDVPAPAGGAPDGATRDPARFLTGGA